MMLPGFHVHEPEQADIDNVSAVQNNGRSARQQLMVYPPLHSSMHVTQVMINLACISQRHPAPLINVSPPAHRRPYASDPRVAQTTPPTTGIMWGSDLAVNVCRHVSLFTGSLRISSRAFLAWATKTGFESA
jgi:hypothetical protein